MKKLVFWFLLLLSFFPLNGEAVPLGQGLGYSFPTGVNVGIGTTAPLSPLEVSGIIATTDGFDGVGAVDIDYGSADITDHTFVTDGTGDTEFVVPDDSIGPNEIDSTIGDYDFGDVGSFEIPNTTATTLPTAGTVGRIAIVTDGSSDSDCVTGGGSTLVTCMDNGTSWEATGDGGGGITIGDTISSGTAGSVLFANASANLGQDNTNFYWNDSSDRLGLGTATPSSALHVKTGGNPGGISIQKYSDTWSSDIRFRNAADSTIWTFRHPSSDDFYIFANSSSRDLILQHNGGVGLGNVGIKNLSPNVELDVTGSIEYTGTIQDVSDVRLKENITPLKGALEKIQTLQAIIFSMKSDETHEMQMGFIAQEVQKVFPEAVKVVDTTNGYLGLDYTQLTAPLVEAIKELKIENDKLKLLVCQDHFDADICQ